MLSRVAERMYWFGRYMERVENTARLVSVNTSLMLDLPRVKHIWGSLVSITGYEKDFSARFTIQNEDNVVKFLLSNASCSVMTSVRMARESARTTREIMPNETWEKINKLYLYLEQNLSQGMKRDGRHELLSETLRMCQELTGYISGCMSIDDTYNFMKIGADLERADMATRILDVGCLNLLNSDYPEIREYDTLLWMSVLKSLTAYQMYRQHVDDRINGEDVADFLLKNDKFPRAVAHCLSDLGTSFRLLPNHDKPLRSVIRTQRLVNRCNVEKLLADDGLHVFMDKIQAELGLIHNGIIDTWLEYH